ncbi:MAG: hypothetical protein HC905_08200 [Bacteroidales bacterium]|nr:hypothetical protein [Bacteroidales bacterium]
MLNTSYKRYSFRVNNDFSFHERIKAGANVSYTNRIHENHATDSWWNILGSAIYAPPTIDFYNPDGTLPIKLQAFGALPQPHPYRMLTERENKYNGHRLLGNAYSEFEIISGLRFKTSINVDIENNNHRTFTPSTSRGAINNVSTIALGTYNTGFQSSWLTENTLIIKKNMAGIN